MLLRIIRILIILSAIGVCGHVVSYFNFEVRGLLNLKEHLIQQLWYQLFFYSHLATGIFALVFGSFQFSSTIRLRAMKFHRSLGKLYVLTAFWCSASGVVIGLFAHGGWFNALGFVLLGVCWFFTTYKGLMTIRKGEVEAHRIWMIRSYACAFVAVTLRIWLLTYPLLGLDFETAYQYVSWVSWLTNMGVAELVIYFQFRFKKESKAVISV